MKIDEYLKNSPIFSLVHAQQALNQQLQKVLWQEQVNFLQALTLITILLEGNHGITPGALVKTFACSKARLSQLLSHLEAQGWIHRTITHNDARCHTLTLSSDGIAKANRLIKCMDQLELKLEKQMTVQSVKALTAHLKELRTAFLS